MSHARSNLFGDSMSVLNSFFRVSVAMSPVAGQHMQWMAICLSSSRMSKSRRGKMSARDKMTEVIARVVFSDVVSHIALFWDEVKKESLFFLKSHFH